MVVVVVLVVVVLVLVELVVDGCVVVVGSATGPVLTDRMTTVPLAAWVPAAGFSATMSPEA